MSDEMIQQQTPSKAKYVVPGAVLGTGAAAALGLCQKPGWAREAAKYASWDEAVAEMTKGDAFVSNIPEELKAEAQNLKNKAVELENEFNSMMKKGATPPEGKTIPEVITKYNEAKTAYKDALKTKTNELLEQKNYGEAKTKLETTVNEWLAKPENVGKSKINALKALKDTPEYAAVRDIRTPARKEAIEALANNEKKTALDSAKKALDEGRTKYINNGMKDLEASGKEKLAALFKKGKVKGGKLALVLGSGLAVGAILGALVSPKKDCV